MAITRAQQFRQMLKDGNVAVQGGVKNYLGEQETVSDVPLKWKSGPNKPATELAYITDAEKKLLLKEDIHGSLKDGPNEGPKGIISLDSQGDKGTYGDTGQSYGDRQTTDTSPEVGDKPSAQDLEDYQKNREIREYNRKQKEKLEALDKAKKTDKDKKLNFAERFRVLSLKNLIDQKKGLKSISPSIFGTIANITTPQLDVYEKSDPNLDDYGMKGKDLTDIDRMVDAIDKANLTGDITQTEFEKAFFGPKGPPTFDNDNKGDGPAYVPPKPITIPTDADDLEDDYYGEAGDPFKNRRAYRLFNKGGIADTVVGGEFDFESGRQMYGLGKLVKKVTRTVKKIAKSPLGKAAIIGGLGYLGATKTAFGQGLIADFGKLSKLKQAGIIGGGLLTAAPFFMKEEEEDEDEQYRGEKLDIAGIRRDPYAFIPRRFAAEGGDIEKEPVAKKTMPLLDMGGKEMDLREEGGFVPIGRMEKADDVPARLSKNEFVFTADAVRNAGDGDVDLGAEKMYNMMKNLEAGGDVSEESQGLEGARRMFQTSKRLEEVL